MKQKNTFSRSLLPANLLEEKAIEIAEKNAINDLLLRD